MNRFIKLSAGCKEYDAEVTSMDYSASATSLYELGGREAIYHTGRGNVNLACKLRFTEGMDLGQEVTIEDYSYLITSCSSDGYNIYLRLQMLHRTQTPIGMEDYV